MVSSANNCNAAAPSQECLVHRLAAFPLVTDALNKVTTSYETTKHYTPLLETTLGSVERSVQYATEMAKPVYDKYLHESVVVASKVACKGLDRLEESYPGVKMTPEQLRELSSEYYEKSYVKPAVDKVVATRDYGVQKVDQTRTYYHQVLASLFNYGTFVLTGSLDYCDELVDKYVAEAEGTIKEGEEESAKSYVGRVQTISSKMASGLSAKASRQAANAKIAVQKAVADFRGAMALVEYAKSTRDWAGQSTSALMDNVAAVKDSLEKQAKQYNIQPEVLLLRWVKLSAAMLSSASEQMLKHTVVYLPDSAKSSLQSAATYLHYLDQSFADAQSLADVKDEVLSEAKDKLGVVEHGLLNVLERMCDYPPLSWMGVQLNSQNSAEKAESESNSNSSTAH